LAQALPRLLYVREPVARDPRLSAMLDRVRQDRTVSYRGFRTVAELHDHVLHDLAVLLSERFGQVEPTVPPTAAAGRLPAYRTALIGREAELAELTGLLVEADVRLVTLTGTGGIGKTRLAVAVAEQLADRFPDGARFVDLSMVTSAGLLGEALARGLGLRTGSDVGSWLRGRRLLLVVDNFEQLIEAAPEIGELVRAARGVTALVTSRAPLRLTAERVYAVPPLSGPPDSTDPETVVAGSAAVRLFVAAARTAVPDFALTPANVGAVAAIARGLGGLPLAIMLAAGKVRMLSPQAIVDHLSDQLALLTGGARDLPARQRTLRDTIAWSYDLLQPAEQALLERLGVFAGGCDLEAIAAVAGGDPLPRLEALVESALVGQHTTGTGTPRFTMLESIRSFALERLRTGDGWHAAHRDHARHYLGLARAAQPHLEGPAGPDWLSRLELEHDNANVALDWILAHDDPAVALDLLRVSWLFWWRRGHIDEVNRHLADIMHHGAGRLPDQSTGLALVLAGGGAFAAGRVDQALPMLERALPLLRAAGDDGGLALATATLGPFAVADDPELAARYRAEALASAARLGDSWQVSYVHSRLALLTVGDGRPEDARDHLRVALGSSAGGQEPFAALLANYTAAICCLAFDDPDRARGHLVDGIGLAAEGRDEAVVSTFLAAFAELAGRAGDPVKAVRLTAAATALRIPSTELWMRACVAPWPALELDRSLAEARLGADAYAAAWAQGEALGLDRAVAEVSAGT
ncbi:ATP-binding protein, partial [Asanoa siamensis]|uniref:ATP-binding protein n=1 Tax=Asanoa siamensis TaxID=926357 RepID=UPI00402B666A